jgi:type II secretory pathway pseudopilin PulG
MSETSTPTTDRRTPAAPAPRRSAFTRIEILIVACVVAVLTVVSFAVLRWIPARAAIAKCGRLAAQLVTAQNAYAGGQSYRPPEVFVDGTEPRTGLTAAEAGRGKGDASRAFPYLAKRGFIDRLDSLACPSDPFVAPLDGHGAGLSTQGDFDLHGGPVVEGSPLPAGSNFSSPASLAATEPGRTFFSYSMQTPGDDYSRSGRPEVKRQGRAFGVLMAPALPLFTERNPWCDVFRELNGGAAPIDASSDGVAWNHWREGVTVAYIDGHAKFRDAVLETPVSPQDGAALSADYLYSDAEAGPTRGDPSKGSCLTAGRPGGRTAFGAWMTD